MSLNTLRSTWNGSWTGKVESQPVLRTRGNSSRTSPPPCQSPLRTPDCAPRDYPRSASPNFTSRCTSATPISHTANLRTKNLDIRGFDSSRIIIVRGGILMSMGVFPEMILVGIILGGRLGAAPQLRARAPLPSPACPHTRPRMKPRRRAWKSPMASPGRFTISLKRALSRVGKRGGVKPLLLSAQEVDMVRCLNVKSALPLATISLLPRLH